MKDPPESHRSSLGRTVIFVLMVTLPLIGCTSSTTHGGPVVPGTSAVQPSDQAGPIPTIPPTPSHREGSVAPWWEFTPTPPPIAVINVPTLAEAPTPAPIGTYPRRVIRLPAPTPRSVAPTPDFSNPTPPDGVNQEAWEALVSFFWATGGPQWNNNENWLSDRHIASWHGVESNRDEVTALRLLENGLTGELPPELGNLYSLKVLNLYGNRLTGPIPPELGNLVRLQSLYIGGNKLTGCIPATLKANIRDQHRQGHIYFGGLDYCSDTRTDEEREATRSAARLLTDRTFGPIARRFPWVADGITWEERGTLKGLYNLSETEPQLTEYLGGTAFFLGQYGQLHEDFISAVNAIREDDLSLFQQLVEAPWFRDDLTTAEAAATTYAVTDLIESIHSGEVRETAIEDFDPSDRVGTKTLNLPSGQVSLAVVRPASLEPTDDSVFTWLEEGIRATEQALGTPWKDNSVVLLLDPEEDEGGVTGGSHMGSHMEVYRSPDDPIFREVLYHELGHYFFDGFPFWLNEGGPEFLKSYALHVNYGVSLAERKRLAQRGAGSCTASSIGNIQEWIDTPASFDIFGLLRRCPYHLGQLFLLEIYEELGHDVVRSSLGELVSLTESSAVNEEAIYDTFLSNTPQGKRDAFREIYDRAHGGPRPGWQPTGPMPSGPDTDSLAALYNATDGANWKLNRYWMTGIPLGRWRGVDTDVNGRVTHLELQVNGLAGPLPSDLGHLTELRELVLNGNRLTGPIPPELGNLSELRILSLGGNRLTGPIPEELGKLSNLISLTLGGQHHQFTGCIPKALQQVRNHDLDRLGLPYCGDG